MDDCFSGLDATTEDKIFDRLLSKTGLLKKSGATVLLATHAAHRLHHADRVVVLSSDGRIVEQGDPQQLMHVDEYFPSTKDKYNNVSSMAAKEPVDINDEFQHGELEDIARAENDLSRQVGDWQIYLYYFQACGWTNTFVFLISMAWFASFMRLPGKYVFPLHIDMIPIHQRSFW